MLRVDVFHVLNRKPDSGTSRSLVTASTGYGLTEGGYQAEKLKLTERGKALAIHGDRSKLVDCALGVAIFKSFFDHYAGQGFPGDVPAKSFLAEKGVPAARLDDCLAALNANGAYVGLVQERSGAKRVFGTADALKSLGGTRELLPDDPSAASPGAHSSTGAAVKQTITASEISRLPSFSINLQIHLPAESSPETYEAIFRGIREQLLDRRE